jgi:hypothetical protein
MSVFCVPYLLGVGFCAGVAGCVASDRNRDVSGSEMLVIIAWPIFSAYWLLRDWLRVSR